MSHSVGDNKLDWFDGTTMSLSFCFALYARNKIVLGNQSQKTEESYTAALRSLIKYVGRDLLITDLDISTVREWQFKLYQEKKSAGTIRGYVSCLRVVLGFLKDEGIEALDPKRLVLPKREQQRIDFLTKEEVAHLIKVAGKKCRGYPEINRRRNQAIISLLYGSGIRVGELCNLDRDSIYNGTFRAFGKGRKERPAFTDLRSEQLLEQYLKLRQDGHSALFLANQTHTRITPGGVQRIVRELGIKAGFKKPIHPHLLRHSFATNLLMNNTNPRHVQRFMGHSSLDTTMIYMHVVDEDLKAIHSQKLTV